MSNNALFTIEQVDNKLIIMVEAVKPETVEQTEPRPMNADEIVTWIKGQVDLALRQPHLVAEINISDKINALVQYELNKAKR